jgi:hypothetical protein
VYKAPASRLALLPSLDMLAVGRNTPPPRKPSPEETYAKPTAASRASRCGAAAPRIDRNDTTTAHDAHKAGLGVCVLHLCPYEYKYCMTISPVRVMTWEVGWWIQWCRVVADAREDGADGAERVYWYTGTLGANSPHAVSHQGRSRRRQVCPGA